MGRLAVNTMRKLYVLPPPQAADRGRTRPNVVRARVLKTSIEWGFSPRSQRSALARGQAVATTRSPWRGDLAGGYDAGMLPRFLADPVPGTGTSLIVFLIGGPVC